jgi:hypothetical protein
MNHAMESVAIKLVTAQGFPMAVGGICVQGTGAYWAERFLQLASLHIPAGDIHAIDYALARAIQHIANESLLIAGCSLDVGSKFGLRSGESTGGVLGCPRDEICSSPVACETLPEGFSLYTAAGGPGLAALADPATTERAVMAVKELGKGAPGQAIMECIRQAGIEVFLFINDGSGSDPDGCLAAASPGKSTVIFCSRSGLSNRPSDRC